ncbi:MAG: hypothetical protein ACYC1S_08455 [Gemmatimonadaceae bacterium]
MTRSLAGVPLPLTAQEVADAARQLADDATRASAQLGAAERELRAALEVGDASGLLRALGRRDTALREIDAWVGRLRQASIPHGERSRLAEMMYEAVQRASEGDLEVQRAMSSLKSAVENALAEIALPGEPWAKRAYGGSPGPGSGIDRRG